RPVTTAYRGCEWSANEARDNRSSPYHSTCGPWPSCKRIERAPGFRDRDSRNGPKLRCFGQRNEYRSDRYGPKSNAWLRHHGKSESDRTENRKRHGDEILLSLKGVLSYQGRLGCIRCESYQSTAGWGIPHKSRNHRPAVSTRSNAPLSTLE